MSESDNARASRGILLGVALISAATLAVQVLQTRLFSVMLWHHLTYMVVTVTLLGFGAGGSLLALFPGLGRAHGDARVAVSTCCSLFGLTLIAAFAILTHSTLDTLDIEANRAQYFFLFLHYAYLVVPFVFAGLSIAIALQQFAGSVHRTYFWNLMGSGVGAFGFILLVRDLGGPGCLFLFASLGGVAGLVSLAGPRQHSAWPSGLLAVLAALIWPLSMVFPAAAETLVPIDAAPSKAQTTFEKFYAAIDRYHGSQDAAYENDATTSDPDLRSTTWTPTCRIDTLAVPKTPGNAAKDRADTATGPRSSVHVFQDGDAPTVIWSDTYARESDHARNFYGLGYSLVERPRVLIIGPGGGNDVVTALHHDAASVKAVDINGDTLALVRGKFGDYTNGIYERERVEAVHSEGRSYLRRAGRNGAEFDLLQMSGTDTYAALSSGSYIFSESYLYTEQAFEDFYRHMSDRGVISVIRFRFEPPREALKLVATAARALMRNHDVTDPRRHFIIVNHEDNQPVLASRAIEQYAAQHKYDRDLNELNEKFRKFFQQPMRYAVMLTRKTAFSDDDLQKIEAALPPMSVPTQIDDKALVSNKLYYGAGLRDDTSNEYGRLLAAMAKDAAAGEAAPGSAEQAFHAAYRYRIEPATDDKPFFFNFHSWSDLTSSPSSDGEGPGYEALTGSEPIGLFVLAALLVQTLIATLILIVVPLFKLGFGSTSGLSRRRVLTYFLALGFAYLLVEISTIQRFVLYLGHPTYSLATGLATFLVFSGLGSAAAGALGGGRKLATAAAILVVGMLAAHAFVLPDLLADTMAEDEWTRIALVIGSIAPLAFFMGMPFPTGLRLLRGEQPGLLAWAFGVNGAASVMASILSIVLAMEAGFSVVILIAAALYLLASATVPNPRSADAAA